MFYMVNDECACTEVSLILIYDNEHVCLDPCGDPVDPVWIIDITRISNRRSP